MNTNNIATHLLEGIKHLLALLGLPNSLLDRLDIGIYLVIILVISMIIGRIAHAILLHTLCRLLHYKQFTLLKNLIEYNALRKLSRLIPPLIIAALLPFAFPDSPTRLILFERITWVCFFIMLSTSVNTILTSIGDAIMTKKELHDRPIKGFIQIMQVLLSGIFLIVIISIIINKSPLNLITGLGAFAAVLMLIFKDTILGFVAGVLLAKNDMVHIGDWIEIPGSAVNGIVKDISLTIVKVENFDNTIITVPPYTLVSQEFINWRAMSESGGRRIMRQYDLMLHYIKPCTPEFLEQIKQFDTDLAEYINYRQHEDAARNHPSQGEGENSRKTDSASNTVSKRIDVRTIHGSIETNAGLLRAYMHIYLKRHPSINQNMLVMVRTLVPTANGLPLQLWCFTSTTDWELYEAIQAEIEEHFVSIMPFFELYPFQNASARDTILSGLLEGGVKAETLEGVPWRTLKQVQ